MVEKWKHSEVCVRRKIWVVLDKVNTFNKYVVVKDTF